MSIKIKYEQKYLDDELRVHIKELLEKLANVPSDDEEDGGEKENLNDENDDEYDTLSEEEEDDEEDENNNKKVDKNCNGNQLKSKTQQTDSKLSSESSNGSLKKSNGKHIEEPMEFT